MKTTVHVIWGAIAVSLYRSGIIDFNVRSAHAAYDFFSDEEADAFVFGISEARKEDEWALIDNSVDVQRLGLPLRGVLISAAMRGDVEMIERLLEMGLNPDGIDQNGMTALHHASRMGHPAVVDSLVRHNANIYLETKSGNHETALHLCAENSTQAHLLAMTHLLNAGAHIEAPDRNGDRPLHYAARCGNLNGVNILLGNKADPTSENTLRRTPSQVAGSRGAEPKRSATAAASSPRHSARDSRQTTRNNPMRSNPNSSREDKVVAPILSTAASALISGFGLAALRARADGKAITPGLSTPPLVVDPIVVLIRQALQASIDNTNELVKASKITKKSYPSPFDGTGR